MARSRDACIKCGSCVRECPVLKQEGPEAFPGPRRLAVEAPRFNRELEGLKLPLTLCTTCARCEAACPSRIPLSEAVIEVRKRLGGSGPLAEGHRRMLENVDRTGRTVLPVRRADEAPTEGDVLFFPGCIGDRSTESASSSLALLRAAGARPYVPPGWACCGSPLEKIGDTERLRKVREANAPLLDRAEAVVTACPGCTMQLAKAYRKEPLHLLEYLRERAAKLKFDPEAPRVRVSLHRPCHLTRAVGPHTISDAREVLGSVPGVELLDHPGQEDCCGGGGGAASAAPEVAAKMARARMVAARDAGADLVLAPCPFCVVNLGRAGVLEVRDLSAFLASRIKRQ